MKKRYAPRYPNEATIQAEFYHRCKLAGIQCILEHKLDYPEDVAQTIKGRKPKSLRVDIGVVLNAQIVAVVEIKKVRRKKYWHKGRWEDSRQGKGYLGLGVPFFVVRNSREINPIINQLRSMLRTKGETHGQTGHRFLPKASFRLG